ncbi:hypothetical protein C8R44DRAFT_981988 [Mycena epipterygia]|nr:hypothetical protein C8R44DRAFT_981988 [Mycena epipterygia]
MAQHEEMEQDLIAAAVLQSEFHAEDRQLRAERSALRVEASDVTVFTCGVCGGIYPEDYVARVAGCAHESCRDCLQCYVVSKLTERVLPTLCPLCVADNAREPGSLTDDDIQILGLTENDYRVFQELQLGELSNLCVCPKCEASMFVDRLEYEAATVLVCPVPGCDHIWCKACQRTIDFTALPHSCGGPAEAEFPKTPSEVPSTQPEVLNTQSEVLNTQSEVVNQEPDLITQGTWKCCPECQTPFEKIDGCNHMQCPSPCSTHFCYSCGEVIVRSAPGQETIDAVAAHYRRCTMFDYPLVV